MIINYSQNNMHWSGMCIKLGHGSNNLDNIRDMYMYISGCVGKREQYTHHFLAGPWCRLHWAGSDFQTVLFL